MAAKPPGSDTTAEDGGKQSPGITSGKTDQRLSDSEIADYSRAARSGFLWIFSTTALWQAFSWICTLATVHILLPEDYGLVAMPDAVFPYLMMLTTLKLDTWLLQTDTFDLRKQESVLGLLVALGLISTLCGLVAAPVLADFYHSPELKLVAQVMCLTFLPRALRLLPESRLRRELQFKQIAVSNLVIGVTRGVFQIVLAYAGFAYWALVLGAVYNEIALLVWLALAGGMPRRMRWEREYNREALEFGFSATGSTIFWVIFSTADNLVVGRLFGKAALGYYSTAFLLTDLPLSKLNTVLAPVITPYYAKLRYNTEELCRVFLRVNRTVVGLVAPALLGLAVVAPSLVPLFFGEQWAPLVGPLQVMSIAGILRCTTANVTSLLFSIGEPNLLLLCSAVPAAIMPFSYYFLGAHLGMPGIYFTWLVIYPLLGPLLLMLAVSKVTPIRAKEFLGNLSAPIVSVLVLALATVGFDFFVGDSLPPIAMLGAQIGIGVVAYLAALKALFPSELDETLAMVRQLRS
ncbi:MAG: oligosaccharide flippase family protein [Bdellovibrionota bacterium]